MYDDNANHYPTCEEQHHTVKISSDTFCCLNMFDSFPHAASIICDKISSTNWFAKKWKNVFYRRTTKNAWDFFIRKNRRQ